VNTQPHAAHSVSFLIP